jgi:endonuclease YncB( thermonuclease family)
MAHDFIKFPELRNGEQMQLYYWESPHKQILEDIRAEVVKVVDGDTIRVKWRERDFDFPVRFLGTNAPEMNEPRGKECRSWLEGIILNQEIDIIIDKNQRVGKWGRLLGVIFFKGMNINEEMVRSGKSTTFEARHEGLLPDLNKMFFIRW